ncbi:hypothetical protein JHK84_032233 [Glycine max]|nr:hypothetical protein JHK85_032668 [Glycine max]KAG5146690.1 hypothetical protein JHK84_032233 [Glycine max]
MLYSLKKVLEWKHNAKGEQYHPVVAMWASLAFVLSHTVLTPDVLLCFLFDKENNNLFLMEISIARSHLETQGIFFSNVSRTIGWESTKKLPCNVASQSSRWDFHRLASSHQAFTAVYPRRPFICRANSMPISLQESASYGDNSIEDEDPSTDLEEETLAKPPTSEQLNVTEDALVKFKNELAVMELEIQALARLAEEIAQCGIPEGSRKINGKYIHSHLVARLEGIVLLSNGLFLPTLPHLCPYQCKCVVFAYIAVNEQLKEQIKDVDAAQSKEVSVFWVGMAESVQVMGTFDGWSQGEHLSPEYTGSYTRFSTTLLLRPGRYEIKFLVDGEWHLSPEFPIIGEGLTKNNLLVVE